MSSAGKSEHVMKSTMSAITLQESNNSANDVWYMFKTALLHFQGICWRYGPRLL